ncbi:hypothetical protein HY479_00030 [Candidatus Uhrbacteria bacterium]|nr:hypothetical protein [Candidatus Uhrbacteria bacterium]
MIRRLAFFLLVGSVMASPFPAFAAPCSGTCLTPDLCQSALEDTPGGQCITADDCPANGCLLEGTASCTGAGGHCLPGGICGSTEEAIGTLDCHPAETCCRLKTSAPAEPGTKLGGKEEAKGPTAAGALALPSCVKTGNCTVDDIVKTGVNFASFLMGLSGALFLVVFIYGGAMYLLSFGDKTRVDKGKKAIKGAAIGILLVMGAWAIVQTLVTAIKPGGAGDKASGTKKTCSDLGEGYECKTWDGATASEVQNAASQAGFSCQTGYCPGDFHNICCKSK